ncbi:Ku protein [Variovorax dokdonensis]|uniref:Non-homologous end joining protein Ku n=1 Tax=Variovorax dokdonensis TaxID=344883 RepID=A0ABT7NGT3_9BURK|nr:Ku protein [Variovorax dokdonensis]MDM0047161.1 Ku protein [Variovorax dokdonensis]
MAAARSIASLTLGFGLVSIPVRLYSATESSATIHFNLLARDGSRVKQQYVSEKDGAVVPRSEMVKGYEFEKDRFVIFQPDELKALENGASHAVDIVAFIPERAVDPIFYDKAYLLAPDKRGGKPYSLLKAAMLESGRCALARWAWKGKQYVVQVRAAADGLVLQQLLYADEVRSLKDLDIDQSEPSKAELQLALQLIDQIAADSYDPAEFQDEEKKRILAAIDAKIAGQEVVASQPAEERTGAEVIDLTEMLRASLSRGGRTAPARGAKGDDAAAAPSKPARGSSVRAGAVVAEAKGAKRAPKTAAKVPPKSEPVAARGGARMKK